MSYEKVGDVQVAQGDLAGALTSYRDSLAIRDRLADADPGNAGWQRDLSVSLNKVGDVQVAQRDLAGALTSYARHGIQVNVGFKNIVTRRYSETNLLATDRWRKNDST